MEYARLRFGIGNEFSNLLHEIMPFDRCHPHLDRFPDAHFPGSLDLHVSKQIDYVLGQWTEEEKMKMPVLLDRAVEIIQSFVLLGTPKTMSLYNGK